MQEKAAIPLHELQVGRIDCTSNWILCQKFKIKGHPTLKHLQVHTHDNGTIYFEVQTYIGKRDMVSLKRYSLRMWAKGIGQTFSESVIQRTYTEIPLDFVMSHSKWVSTMVVGVLVVVSIFSLRAFEGNGLSDGNKTSKSSLPKEATCPSNSMDMR